MLDIGARDGHIARLLATRFRSVVAMDIVKPAFTAPGVALLQADATQLPFADGSIDTVLCSEVLEHIPPALLARAAREIARVVKHDVVIGVPYRQDTRVGETTCSACGAFNPPYGHVNRFEDDSLDRLFSGLDVVQKEYVWVDVKQRTTWIVAKLLRQAGNPWGTYGQEERCIRCAAQLTRRPRRTLIARGCGALAIALQRVYGLFSRRREAHWLHVRLAKHVARSGNF